MKKNKRKVRYLALVLLLLFISIGYAYLNSTLNITGASTINNPTWDIHWENVEVKPGSVSASTPTIDTNKTTVTYSVNLTTPGDFYEFTVDAVNAGSIDGMVSVVTSKMNGTEITTLPNYLEYSVTYYDDIAIEENHLLAANTSEKYKVHVGYKKDISQSDMPTTIETLNFGFSVIYVQSDTNVVPVPHPEIVYTVNIWDGNKDTIDAGTNTSLVWTGKSILSGITTYQTPELAMEALKQATGRVDRPFFLKHTILNNVVTDSYVGFVVSEEVANNNLGMTSGTYYLKAKKTSELVEGTWQCISEYDDGNGNCLDPDYDTKKAILLSAFGNSNCTEYSSFYMCSISDLYAYATSQGSVRAYDTTSLCHVSYEGYSYCRNI